MAPSSLPLAPAYRAPARVRHLDHLNMTVKDLRASLAFYKALFGFDVVEADPGANIPWAIIKSGAAMLCLYEHPQLPEGPHFPDTPNQLGMSHFALRLEDAGSFEELTRALGIPLLFGGPVRWPHSTSYYLADPSGHHIEAVAWNNNTITFDPLPEGLADSLQKAQ